MRIVTPQQVKIIDQLAMEETQIPALLLMENAALRVAEKAREMMGISSCGGKIVVIAGKGNNGGDAFAAARHLCQWGYEVTTVSLVPEEEIKGEAAVYLAILKRIQVRLIFPDAKGSLAALPGILSDMNLIIDGIFGTGFHGEITGYIASVIRMINEEGARVLSVDVPSGVNGQTGQIGGIAVKADETVTFSLPKPGIFQYPGKEYCGRITVADIGIPDRLYRQCDLKGELLDEALMSGFIPKRPQDGHKGSFGKVLIITGSKGMTGAGALTARAAFKTGSGLVYLAVPESLAPVYGATIPEAITFSLPDEKGFLAIRNPEELIQLANMADMVIIGPGLSTADQTRQWVAPFIMQCPKPMVIDADAINILAETPEALKKRKSSAVITPHPGEFSRITGISVHDIQSDRVEKACDFSRKFGLTVVLKGAGTVIALPDGKYYINTTGNSGLAVAGSGDVLSGVIGSLIGQGLCIERAAALGAYVHGKCGELLAEKNNYPAGFSAGEICGEIPVALGKLQRFSPQRV